MNWWLQNNLRMIQNNLRDTDADMDVKRWFEEIKKSHANAVMVGAGGISSFYPTGLSCQTVSPYLKGDLLKEIVTICHQNNVKVIARFDFSKTHVRLLKDHPEWYYVSEAGEHLYYNDTAATCVLGEYQQEKSVEIIREVLEHYDVDGIFFNMFGFQTKDYSNVEHGICCCPACRKAYFEFSGKELPKGEAWKTDQTYSAFKEAVVQALLSKIHREVRKIRPDVAVCTYHHKDVDIIRDESNSAVDRPLPFFLYASSDNCQTAAYSWADEKTMANVAINAVDIFYRFQGVSPELTALRLYGNIAAGSQLDYCIIGDFKDYPDRAGLNAMREVFAFHEKNEAYYGHLRSNAKILLYRPDKGKEYHGLFQMLKELHLPFDVIDHPAVLEKPEKIGYHQLLIVPDGKKAPQEMIGLAKKRGTRILYTNLTDSNFPASVYDDLGVTYAGTIADTRAGYLSVQDKARFQSFADRDWVIADKQFGLFERKEAQEPVFALPLISPAMFGPPERCFGHVETEHPGFIENRKAGVSAFTFPLGFLYQAYGYTDHREILKDVLTELVPDAFGVQCDLPASVEFFVNRLPDGRTMLQFLNWSGYTASGMDHFIPVHDASVLLPGTFSKVERLTGYEEEADNAVLETEKGQTRIKLPVLGLYAAFVLE